MLASLTQISAGCQAHCFCLIAQHCPAGAHACLLQALNPKPSWLECMVASIACLLSLQVCGGATLGWDAAGDHHPEEDAGTKQLMICELAFLQPLFPLLCIAENAACC